VLFKPVNIRKICPSYRVQLSRKQDGILSLVLLIGSGRFWNLIEAAGRLDREAGVAPLHPSGVRVVELRSTSDSTVQHS
jgi:hypothetical protein